MSRENESAKKLNYFTSEPRKKSYLVYICFHVRTGLCYVGKTERLKTESTYSLFDRMVGHYKEGLSTAHEKRKTPKSVFDLLLALTDPQEWAVLTHESFDCLPTFRVIEQKENFFIDGAIRAFGRENVLNMQRNWDDALSEDENFSIAQKQKLDFYNRSDLQTQGAYFTKTKMLTKWQKRLGADWWPDGKPPVLGASEIFNREILQNLIEKLTCNLPRNDYIASHNVQLSLFSTCGCEEEGDPFPETEDGLYPNETPDERRIRRCCELLYKTGNLTKSDLERLYEVYGWRPNPENPTN